MESFLLIIFAMVAALGLCAMLVGLFHPAPGRTRLIRALCWPGITPSDGVALPLGCLFFFTGAAMTSSSWLPFSARMALVLAGVVAAIVLLRRRSDA